MRKRKDKLVALPIPGVAENVYTQDLQLGERVLTPMGIARVSRRIPLFPRSPGRYRLFLDLESGGSETIKLITTQFSIWHIPY